MQSLPLWESLRQEGDPTGMLGEVGPHDALKRGTVLRGYSIRSVLGRGGFGIVYRARHLELGYLVAIKEYLPGELAVRIGLRVQPKSTACIEPYRDGLRRFRDEGKALVELHEHPNVVSCRDFFRCHGTAYLVMEFVRGMPLSRHLQQCEAKGLPLGEEDLMAVAIPLIEGLGRIHDAGVVHRDIKPENVLLREENRQPVLIDFGAAKQGMATHTKSIAPRTPEYAAWEQVVPEGDIGPWTDIYAIGVLLWRIVSGGGPDGIPRSPVAVESRMDAHMRSLSEPMHTARRLGHGRFDDSVLATIDSCMKLRHDERVQDCAELLGLLRGDAEFQYGLGMKYFKIATEPHFSERPHDNINSDRLSQYVHTDLFKWHRYTTENNEHMRTNSGLLPETIWWMNLAATKRQSDAQHHLAFMTYYGIGITRSISSAMKWWYKAAKQGNVEAQYTLGIIWTKAYLNAEFGEEYEEFDSFGGEDIDLLKQLNSGTTYTKQNTPYEAAKWLSTAAENGHSNARLALEMYGGEGYYMSNSPPFLELQFQLGRVYHRGKSVPQNYHTALTWYWTAANWFSDKLDQAHHHASMSARKEIPRLIDQYLTSPGLTKRTLSNAKRGDTTSQYNLAWMYSTGTNLPTNHELAVYWYRLAAQQGDAGAQNNLGVCYMLGYGVPRDQRKAVHWFRLATDSPEMDNRVCYLPEQVKWEDDAATACFRLACYRRSRSSRGGISAIYDYRSLAQFNSTQFYLRNTSLAAHNLGISLLRKSERHRSICFKLGRGDKDGMIEHELAGNLASNYDECFKNAAYFDHANAQYQLGNKRLKFEHNTCRDESMAWFRKSAEQDHIGSLHMLANHYREHNKPVADWATKRYCNVVKKLLKARRRRAQKTDLEMHHEAINWYASGGLRCDVPSDLRLDLIYDVGDNEAQEGSWLDYIFRFDSVEYDFMVELFRDSDCDGETHFFRGLVEQIYGDHKYEYGPNYMFRMDEAFQHFKRATTVASHREQHEYSEIDYSSGHPGAMNNLGIIYALGHQDVRDHDAAISEFLRAAEFGHPAAQFNLGVCYLKGIGGPVNECEAFRWFRRCTESSAEINCRRVTGYSLLSWSYVQNCPPVVDSLFNLAVCYMQGIGTPRDVDSSIEFLSRAARECDQEALHCLALPRLGGILEAVPDDDWSSIESIQKRMGNCSQGYSDSEDCAVLGWRYAIGVGVNRDAIRAFMWFMEASKIEEDSNRDRRGVCRSMSSVSWRWMFHSGRADFRLRVLPWSLRFIDSDRFTRFEISSSETPVSEICRIWAELGDPDAQYFYAWMCAGGEATERRLSEAFRWYRLAANQGHVSASYRLAVMYDEGRGVDSDPAEAARWYELSAKDGIPDAQYRLGLLYENGRGVERDWDLAAEWYEMAAARGDLLSKYRLCVISRTDGSSSHSRLDDYFHLYYEILRDREVSDLDWSAEALDDQIQPCGFRLLPWGDEGGG